MTAADRSPHGSRYVRSSSPPISSPHPPSLHTLLPARRMSPLSRQSTIFLPPGWTGEPNSDPFWIDRVASSTFHEETLRLFEGVTMPLGSSAPLSIDHPLPSLDDDNLSPPPALFGGAEGTDGMSFAFPPSTMPFGVQPDELYVTFSSSRRRRSQLLTAFRPIVQLLSCLPGHLRRIVP